MFSGARVPLGGERGGPLCLAGDTNPTHPSTGQTWLRHQSKTNQTRPFCASSYQCAVGAGATSLVKGSRSGLAVLSCKSLLEHPLKCGFRSLSELCPALFPALALHTEPPAASERPVTLLFCKIQGCCTVGPPLAKQGPFA